MFLKTLLTSMLLAALAATTMAIVAISNTQATNTATTVAAPQAMNIAITSTSKQYTSFTEPSTPLAENLRTRCTTTMLIVHHSDSDHDTVDSIRRYHVEHNGWDDIGYHYVIERDGAIKTGRDMRAIGAHANMNGVNRNLSSIGICVVGKDSFTVEQLDSLSEIIDELSQYYGLQLKIDSSDPYYKGSLRCHHENCPGPFLSGWLAENY